MEAVQMKLVLISPKGPLYRHRGGIFKRNLRYAPLTLTTLAAYIPPELGIEVEIVDEGIEDVDLNLKADLIGMTVITGSSMRAYRLADHFRSRGIPVVLGGPHITLIPDDAQPHADAIVVGYAEDTWPQLLRDFVSGQMKSRYVQGSNLSLANRPFPRRDLIKAHHYLTTHVFEATRGCVHSCDFCVVPTAWGLRPYQKPVEEIIADIKQHWGRRIIFIDLNLIADKEYAAKLFEALIPLKLNWFGLSTVLLGKEKPLLELAARSGCTGLLMGFESITPENLKQSLKGFNSPAQYKELTSLLHRYGITLMACFTFGMDSDTPDIFMQTARFAIDAGIDLPRYAIVTPFPNTGLYKRLESEGRILTKNWELYDAQHVVFQPMQMTPQQLYEGHEKAWKHTYSYSAMVTRYLKSRIQTPVWWVANMGYRFYSHHLHDFYNCDWIIGQLEPQKPKADLIQVTGD
jgi:radical SAM superfamily enzyme YgiQ (UPF0313 family)